jgi:glycyl-tRNA synthetase (class II)
MSLVFSGASCARASQLESFVRRTYTPSVIEPSFGIGRIIYCVFEHSFYNREGDEKRTVFSFSPVVAPYKATVFPLLHRKELDEPAEQLSKELRAVGLANIVDTTGRCSQSCNQLEIVCRSFKVLTGQLLSGTIDE